MAAGISPEQAGWVLDKQFNEDQVVGRLLYAGKEPMITFSMTRPGFVTDRLADVTVKFSFYDMAATGRRYAPGNRHGRLGAQPGLCQVPHARARLHRAARQGQEPPFQGGGAPGVVMDGGPGLTGNLRTKNASDSRDITWLDGHWNTHPDREFSANDARVLARCGCTRWKENAVGRLAPALHVQHVLLEHALDFYRPAPRPRLLPPPGLRQTLPAAQLPLLSNTDRLEFPHLPLRQPIRQAGRPGPSGTA